MSGEKRILGADDPYEAPSQPTARVMKPEIGSQTVSFSKDTKAVIKREDSFEEIVTQCPPVSSSRRRSPIQRASTFPSQQPNNSSNNPVQRSRTAPNLDSRSIPSTPKKSVRGQKPPASNVRRSRVISISDGGTTDEEIVPSSPATNVSCTLSPTFGHHFPSSPRETISFFPSPVRPGDQPRRRCCRSGACEDNYDHRTPTARPMQGSKGTAQITSASPSRKTTIISEAPVQGTGRGTSHQHQPAKKVVRGSPSTSRAPPVHRGTLDLEPHTPRDRSEDRLPPSPGGSSQLTYVSDDQRPAATSTPLTGDSDYYTAPSRNPEVSDADSEPPRRVSSSTSKRKGKHRISPPPPSSPPSQGSPINELNSSSPSLSIDSSLQDPSSMSGPNRKKRRNRYSRPPSPRDGERTQPQGHSQSLGQDVCHCTGPCPSCHRPRPPPPQVHPFMFQPGYYPYLYVPPPHMPNVYHLTHYGPPPYPYPYAIPQQTGPIPSISSAQLLPPAPATHPPTAYPSPPIHSSPAPAPAPPTPAPVPSTSARTSSPSPVGSPPVDHPAARQAPTELLEALDQFYQPPQRPVKVIDPSCDPRSPYSREATVPALLNR